LFVIYFHHGIKIAGCRSSRSTRILQAFYLAQMPIYARCG
jgi:hypothetical protein